MKTIIIPTDFSPAALNATNYAADLALEIHAEILLLHVYQIPVAVTDTPLPLLDLDELKQVAEDKLEKHKKDLAHITSNGLTISTRAILGNMAAELEELCREVQPFAIVMGTTGHSSLERTLFGSNTLSAIKHLTWPVICVPMGKEYGLGIKKIGLACDFREVAETTPIAVIRSFVKELKAELHVLNVDKGTQEKKSVTEPQIAFLETALSEANPIFHFIQHTDIEDGINEFAEKNNLDVIITIPKKHRLLESLFRKSATKRLVFESHIPVMCIHE
jgi:nucleotide-binding universal stress UspA family protein